MYKSPSCGYYAILSAWGILRALPMCMVIDSRKAAVGGRDEGDEALERDAELGEESSEV